MVDEKDVLKEIKKLRDSEPYQAGILMLKEAWDKWKKKNPSKFNDNELCQEIWSEFIDGLHDAVRGEM